MNHRSAFLEFLPLPPEELAKLEPEELGGYVLEFMNSTTDQSLFNEHNFLNALRLAGHPEDGPLQQAVMEAWGWLEREVLLRNQPDGRCLITRRGKKIKGHADLDAMRRADLLPRKLLHPNIAAKIWATFLHGDYDTAIFQSFKEVEVRVRNACGFGDKDMGVRLMRKAFHPTAGPLTNVDVLVAEREAVLNLFAGAIGLYKNPHSHRTVSIEASEAVEMIMLASHLMNIVDARKPP